MRLYFDTNVYRFISEKDELSFMRELLDTYGCVLVASSSNLFETLAIKKAEDRRMELNTLVCLAHRYTQKTELVVAR